jgi:hypothetical protein
MRAASIVLRLAAVAALAGLAFGPLGFFTADPAAAALSAAGATPNLCLCIVTIF